MAEYNIPKPRAPSRIPTNSKSPSDQARVIDNIIPVEGDPSSMDPSSMIHTRDLQDPFLMSSVPERRRNVRRRRRIIRCLYHPSESVFDPILSNGLPSQSDRPTGRKNVDSGFKTICIRQLNRLNLRVATKMLLPQTCSLLLAKGKALWVRSYPQTQR